MANTVTFRQLGNLFDCASSTAWTKIGSVCSWLVSIRYLYIFCPTNEQVKKVTEGFASRKGIDHIIGAIDCTHIKIKAPHENKSDYFDRNRNYSVFKMIL